MSQRKQTRVSRRKALAFGAGAAGAVLTGSIAAGAETEKKQPLKGKKVLVAIGEFSEGLETWYIVFRLMEEGVVPVVVASQVKRVQMVVHDFDPKYTNYIEMPGYMIESEIAYKDVKPADYDGIIIPGGRGPEEMRQRKDALDVVGYFMDNDLPVGAMCHGQAVLYSARSVKGRKMTAFAGIKADIIAAGATWVDAPVVVDGSMVTSDGWPVLPKLLPAFIDVLAKSSKKKK